jgi:Spy/CpxP family protein refolding chaperone
MKRNLMIFATVATMTAGMALAQQSPANPQASSQTRVHRPFAARRHKMMQALNLTDAQKQQAKAIFQENRQKTEPIRTELRQNREAMRAAVKSDNSSQIEKLSKTDGELMGRLVAARTEARAKFYRILTPEQRNKVEQLHAAFRQRMQQRRAAVRTNS